MDDRKRQANFWRIRRAQDHEPGTGTAFSIMTTVAAALIVGAARATAGRGHRN